LYKSKDEFEKQLDKLFTIPWNPEYIAFNINSFIGQYTQSNQPDHGYPYLYYFIGKQAKGQEKLNLIMDRFYGMGPDGLALCGMDDAGEMSAWYVFNAMGFYPYSPADPSYIVTVPLFSKVDLKMPGGRGITISRKNKGTKIVQMRMNGMPISGFMLSHDQLRQGGHLQIMTQ
jgi:putative alpha-1,2-mannosidase